VSERLLRLPFYTDLSRDEQEHVTSTVMRFRFRSSIPQAS